ncbi:hypothetical protein Nepgr_024590 [Nepenthes gracilis]|uniref:NB-ARC domain-containing protein n=1 Tax=Nepenthes gracilis TaxID=150966 RepID=A0AAD3T4S8_NEPGR|nr:hypothetical protein Nepgr_024590 [Nepenthes gracilis]
MLEHCQGLPLAIVVLGAILAMKKTLEEWQTVNDNICAYLGRGMAHGQSYRRVYDVLAMSYYDLPYHLKPCFLHLGNFPEDYEIDTKKLYRMWIAEGIVAASSERTLRQSSLEEEAEYCLNELVQKRMVQVGKVGLKGKIKTCHLHDMIRDVCLEIGKVENFMCVIDLNQINQDEPPPVLNERLRRLAIYVGEEADASLLDSSFEKAPNIRSLLLFPNQECKQEHYGWMRSVCNEFELLRVLDLNGFNIEGSLPKEIGNLIYLKFLSLNQTRVTKVPASIGYLSCLETLDLRVFGVVVMLPNVFWKLRRLKHLYFPSRILSQEVDTKQGYMIKRGEMMRLDGLQYLETLKNIDIDRVEVKGLLGLKNMRRLTASCVSKKGNLDPFLKSLSIKRLSLKSLKIDGSIVSENPMILSSCQPLHSLDIDNKICGSLHFEMFPENLVYIGLWYCNVENDPMPVFEWLPRLKNLSLHICYRGNEMECSAGGFPQLTYLAIDGLFWLHEWKVGPGALAKLESMEIYNSPIRVLPNALPSCVKIVCNPCVKGIEKYNSCLYYKGQFE